MSRTSVAAASSGPPNPGGLVPWFVRYYTSWSCLALLGCVAGILPEWTFTSVKMMLLTSVVGGTYIAHFGPKRFIMKDVFPVDIELEGLGLYAAGFAAHQAPFLYALAALPAGGGAYLYWASAYAYYKLFFQDLYSLYFLTAIDAALILLVSTGAATLLFAH
jgi:hypothetical protein